MRAPFLRPAPKRRIPLRAAPYVGMRDAVDPSTSDPRFARLLKNCYPNPGSDGPPILGRPGFRELADLGGRVQFIGQFTKLDGTEYTVAVAAGELWTINWGARSATKVVTTADLTTAALTLSPTARVYGVVFADELVLSDGVNTPFTWDGTTGAAGLTKLTNAPVFYGQPTVYGAKLFGIKAAERSTIVWSEESDPTTGYEVGHDNAWTLRQTDQNALYRIHGTNAALYYTRARSIGAILGAVEADFRTASTHEAVSVGVGSESPAGFVQHEDSIFFMDADARPQRLLVGGGLMDSPPLWQDCFETVRRLPKDQLGDAMGVDYTPAGLVLLGHTRLGATEADALLAFNPETGFVCGVWDGFSFTALGMAKDGEGDPVLLHGTDAGLLYDHGNPEGDVWDDAGAPINHEVESGVLGYDEADVLIFDRADLSLYAYGNMTNLALDYVTPGGGRSTAQTFDIAGDYAVWGEFEWGTDPLGGVPVDQHVALGLAAEARWIQPRIRHGGLGERFGFNDIGIDAYPAGRDPAKS